MQSYELLEFGNYYHIYNHGVGGRDLFKKTDNYEYFLDLYEKYISPIAETYAWVLMHNHFHLLVRIKEEDSCFTPDRVSNPVRGNRNRIPCTMDFAGMPWIIPGALTSPVFQLN